MNKIKKMKYLWKGQNLNTKVAIIRACIFPTAIYGCESWILTEKVKGAINVFEMKCYRRVMSISWREHRTNQSIREQLGIEENWLLHFISKLKLKYFGHIKRHNCLEKTFLEGRLAGKRRRGRPRKRWEKDIEELLKISVVDAGRKALNRSSFRGAIREATSN